MSESKKINVNPSLTTLVDEKVDIIVSNLRPDEMVTLQARTVDDNNLLFVSTAKYRANRNGEVLVSSQASLGGSYTGVEPMGLFWSMKPDTNADKHDFLTKRNVTVPLNVIIDVFDEFGVAAASVTLERCFIGTGVTRCTVEGDGFYGTIFLPPGKGPFPGVVDLWGLPGGIREDRAALLASNGFVALALAYWGFKDLPKRYGSLSMSYFEKAVDWLISHDKVMSGGIGVVGLSMGGVLALAIASQIPEKIKAVVSISGPPVLIGCTLCCNDFTIQGFPVEYTDDTYVSYSHYLSIFKSKEACKPGAPSLVPVERITGKVLLVYGLDDQLNTEIDWMCEETYQRMEQHGKGSLCKRLPLPGTGHFITPCYLPPCSRHYVERWDDTWFLGGENKAQSKAQEFYWNESLKFLKENIIT
ncbi:acyl-coenzyme A amino acid N-acyltransferase 1-like [Dendronephthya gigantea]|uniref:acyl-coenzyme A amino acid N-acyltransferase 1-like n=1 Tax=Dendronephthya gigantea TaxID=151771 RepID=UPI00106CC661|nr:acyl-coenzyme A amino acid N-acyltransferase 1-like [Dendronephthya gigantea]